MFEELMESIKARQAGLNHSIADGTLAMRRGAEGFAGIAAVGEQLKSLHSEWKRGAEDERSFFELPFQKILRERYDEKNQVKLMKYMTRVRESAGAKMLEDESFAAEFLNNDEFNAVILSADIRRSTELMLRCESPRLYAEFLNALTQELSASVKNRYGIYDKFTGDGLLAFFPDFYSGGDAVLYALQCAFDCQKIFDTLFEAYKDSFDIDRSHTGMGVGIDSGIVFKAGEDLEYTVVGKPVVYACRLSSAPAGHAYLTGRARALLKAPGSASFKVAQTTIAIKHEDDLEAFDVSPLSDVSLQHLHVQKPAWAQSQ